MDEDDDQAGGEAAPPPPRRKAAPKTIRISSSKPIPPGRVDVTPTGRSRRMDLDPRMIAIIGVIVVVVLIVAGIFLATGGDDEDEDPRAATAAPTVDAKDRFVARGDALCRRANRQGERLLFPESPEQFPPYLEEVRSIAVNLISDLKKLGRPEEDRRLLRRLFSKLDRLPAVLSDAQAGAAAGDAAEVDRLLSRAETIEHQANALALQYGFVDCSQP